MNATSSRIPEASSAQSSSSSTTTSSSRIFIEKLLGEQIICTLNDGRTASGRFVSVDRLMNIILSDCTTRQTIVSTDYVDDDDDEKTNNTTPTIRDVHRHLQQAMVPGNQVKSIEIQSNVYHSIMDNMSSK